MKRSKIAQETLKAISQLGRAEAMFEASIAAQVKYGEDVVDEIGNTLVVYRAELEDTFLDKEELRDKYEVNELTSDDNSIAYGDDESYVAFNFSNKSWSVQEVLAEVKQNYDMHKWVTEHIKNKNCVIKVQFGNKKAV